MIKICSKCGVEKSIDEYSLVFPAKKDGKLRPDCKECVRKRSKKVYLSDPEGQKERWDNAKEEARIKAKKYIINYLSTHPCVDCGETDLVVLDFDHIKGEKILDVSAMVSRGYRLWKIIDEIEKCEVRCANDHRRRHNKVLG